ncbi:sulfurtransferase complex subunit TusC [Rheinheimera sp. D18]|uniref:sulfurtransferase complex subunit TusC n=1 Tax=Rheinheimera sp. D18 TaxID=2545632 RepID=UPI00104913E9|nr:sulfurtransferase complex subunit TusC [Rheinheimera sp. D18]QBL09291.1 sulfurtransferase complex subunit TusC [Rheinheimera sp. D18]
MRNILVLQRHSPFSSSNGREALDMALALAAVEYSVSILFCADAVFQLLPIVEHADFKLKIYPRSFKLFNLYDIEQVYVCQQSLSERGISLSQLSISVTALNKDEIQHVLSSQHQIISS